MQEYVCNLSFAAAPLTCRCGGTSSWKRQFATAHRSRSRKPPSTSSNSKEGRNERGGRDDAAAISPSPLYGMLQARRGLC